MRLIGLLSALAILFAAIPAVGSIIVAVDGGSSRITVLDADEVNDAFVRAESGRPVLRLPNGEAWELIPDTDDPDIANAGDGDFHPIDPQEVVVALQAVAPRFTRVVEATIYILPMPRRGLLDSSASDGVICLSPGVRAIAPAQVHALVAHEFGHVAQRWLLPDSDDAAWLEYRELRGIADTSVFYSGAAHKNRPHEIFAEDFRYLFGGAQANLSGSIENAGLALPDAVYGLREWMSNLVVSPTPAPALAVANFPDPFVSQTTIRWSVPTSAGTPGTLRIFDAAGRLVRTLGPGAAPSFGDVQTVVWDGHDEAGRTASAGVYFAVLSAGSLRVSETLHLVR
jgi:hypothetical protein